MSRGRKWRLSIGQNIQWNSQTLPDLRNNGATPNVCSLEFSGFALVFPSIKRFTIRQIIWADNKTASCWTFHSANETSESVPKEKAGLDERERDYGVLSYDERGMVVISYGFESYHPLIMNVLVHFLYLGPITFSLIANQTLGSKLRLMFSGGPKFGCLVRTRARRSFYTTKNQPDYQTKRSKAWLKWPNNLGVKAPLFTFLLRVRWEYWHHSHVCTINTKIQPSAS